MSQLHATSIRAALPVTTTLRLGASDLVAFDVLPGDRLRSDCGTVWITIDGEQRDLLVEAGQVHTVDEAARLHVSALHVARLVVIGRAPAHWHREGASAASIGARARDWLGRSLRHIVSGNGRRRWVPQAV